MESGFGKSEREEPTQNTECSCDTSIVRVKAALGKKYWEDWSEILPLFVNIIAAVLPNKPSHRKIMNSWALKRAQYKNSVFVLGHLRLVQSLHGSSHFIFDTIIYDVHLYRKACI